ncbi:hypothetical protein ES703_76196 [subsurface metagenome]
MKKKVGILVALVMAISLCMVPAVPAVALMTYDPCVAANVDFIYGIDESHTYPDNVSHYGEQWLITYTGDDPAKLPDGYNLYRDDVSGTGDLAMVGILTFTPDEIDLPVIDEFPNPSLGTYYYMGEESPNKYYWALEPNGIENPSDGQADLDADVVQPTLTVNIVGEGTVKFGTYPASDIPIEAVTGPGTYVRPFDLGTNLLLNAIDAVPQDPNWMWDGWSGDYTPFVGGHAAVKLDGNKTITATFIEKIVSIIVDPTTIDFGPIIQGGTGTDSLNVANSGTVPASVTATLDGTDVEFYTANLLMDGGSVTAWSANLPVSESVDVSLTLNVPAGAEPGAKTATIIFWAEESTP